MYIYLLPDYVTFTRLDFSSHIQVFALNTCNLLIKDLFFLGPEHEHYHIERVRSRRRLNCHCHHHRRVSAQEAQVRHFCCIQFANLCYHF
jgi:hypothetical protein